MNSQPARPRLSASQGAARTPTNFIKKNKEMLARLAQQKHQATPMPSRHNSQPPPKLKVKADVPPSPVLPPVSEDAKELSQSNRKKTPGEVFLEKVYGEDVPAVGATYEELARSRPSFASKDLTTEFKSPLKQEFTSLEAARAARKTTMKEDVHHPTDVASAESIVQTPKKAPELPPRTGTPITTKPTEDKPPFVAEQVSPRLQMDQTYASSRKSLLASQAALQDEVPATTEKTTPAWSGPSTEAPSGSVEVPGKQMEEIKLFEQSPMKVEADFPSAATPEKRTFTPKSILKKSAASTPAPIPKSPEGRNTEASDTESSESEAPPQSVMSSPVHKRKRFNAALLTEFDVPAAAFSDCDVFYDAEIKCQSAKRRKRGK